LGEKKPNIHDKKALKPPPFLKMRLIVIDIHFV